MRNLKHSAIAVIAVAMISSLAAAQVADINEIKTEREHRINAASASDSITIAEKELADMTVGIASLTAEDDKAEAETAEVLESEIAAKSFLPIAYVIGSESEINIMALPSENAETAGTISVGSEVQVMESSEDWFKVIDASGVAGYIKKELVTQNSSAANEAKMSVDNYKIAQVSTGGSSVRVRAGASTDTGILDELEDGRYVYILGGENDFIKVCYGDRYEEGYVINTALEFVGEWENKDELRSKQQTVKEEIEAARRAEEARQAEAERAQKNAQAAGVAGAVVTSGSGTGQSIVNTAMQYLGVPYVWGGTSPSGFDCSGLVQYVCRKNGISVARVAADQRNCGTYVSRENLQPGDLVFFAKGGSIHHVGIYVGNGNMIHAPQTGDVVKVSSINTDYRRSQYAGAVRVY